MTISPFSTITEDGDYELQTRTGWEHLLTLKGAFDGATVVMTAFNNATETYTSVDDASWTAEAEARFYAPSNLIRLTVSSSGASTEIAVNLVPLHK